MSFYYIYSIVTNFPNGIDTILLSKDILFKYPRFKKIKISDDSVYIVFNENQADNLTLLNEIIAAHNPTNGVSNLSGLNIYKWVLVNALINTTGTSLTIKHSLISSYATSLLQYPYIKENNYISCILPNISALPEYNYPENCIQFGTSGIYVLLFNNSGISYISYNYPNGSSTKRVFSGGDRITIITDNINITYTLSGSHTDSYTKSFESTYPTVNQVLCGFVDNNTTSPTNLIFTLSELVFIQSTSPYSMNTHGSSGELNTTGTTMSSNLHMGSNYITGTGTIQGFYIPVLDSRITTALNTAVSAQTISLAARTLSISTNLTAIEALQKSGGTMTGSIDIGTNNIIGTTGYIQGYNIPALNSRIITAQTDATSAQTDVAFAKATATSAQSSASFAIAAASTAQTTATNALPLSGGVMVGNINSRTIIPTVANTYDLGSSTNSFNNIYTSNIKSDTTGVVSIQRIKQTLNSSSTFSSVNGYYGLAKNAYPALNSTSIDVNAAISKWTGRGTNYARYFNICWSPELGIFVSLTGSTVVSSSDGITWTYQNSNTNNTWSGICWASKLNLFIAVSSSGSSAVSTSPNGSTWTQQTVGINIYPNSVCWSPELDLLVVVGAAGSMTSPDGITWTLRFSYNARSWTSVCWSPELCIFVAVSNTNDYDNKVMTSPDGITWTVLSAGYDMTLYSVCWSSKLGIFVVVSTSGTNRAMTSPDGITWTMRSTGNTDAFVSVCWSPELGIFVASSIDGTKRIMTSPDGITWTARLTADGSWRGICWSPELGLFAACGDSMNGGVYNLMTSSLVGRPPTSYNVFNNSCNRIDETGYWKLKLTLGPIYILSRLVTVYNLTSILSGTYQNAMISTNGIINRNNILANTLEVGSSFSINFRGTSTSTLSTDKVGIGLYVDTTVIAGTGGNSIHPIGNMAMIGDVIVTITKIGTSGIASVCGGLTFKSSTNAVLMTTLNTTVSINTTQDNIFKLALLVESTGVVSSAYMTLYTLIMKQIY